MEGSGGDKETVGKIMVYTYYKISCNFKKKARIKSICNEQRDA